MLSRVALSAIITSGMVISSPVQISDSRIDNSQNVYSFDETNNYLLDNQMIVTSNGQVVSIIDSQLNKNFSKLDIFQNFKDNWNGYDSKGFSYEFIQKIKDILYHLPKQPQIFPISYGSIQFEYELKDGSYLEFEISPQLEIKMFSINSEGYEIEKEIEKKDISLEVSKFYGLL